MRGGTLAAGIILLILGIFFYSIGNNMIQEIEAYDIYDLPISELLKTISQDARTQYELGQAMVMFGGIFGIIGFILCIAGIAAPGKKPEVIIQKPLQNEVTRSDRICPNCGRVIPVDSELCPYCGKRFKLYVEKDEESKKEVKKEEEPPSNGKEVEEKKEETNSLEYCPKCGNKLEEGLKFCPKCGSKLE